MNRPTISELALIAAHIWPTLRATDDDTDERISKRSVEVALDLWNKAGAAVKAIRASEPPR